MSQTSRLVAPLLTLGLILTARGVDAQAPEDNADSEARGLFLAGQAAFEGGRFEEALEHFERAYELSERPELLYNIGTTAERLRIDSRAIEAYEGYLERLPEAPFRANVEGRLRVLREQVAQRRAAARPEAAAAPDPAPPPAAVSEAEPPPERSNAGLGWGLSAGGFALLAGGAVSLGLAASSRSAVRDVPEGTPWTSVATDAERVDRRRRVGIGLLAVGAALAGVGLVLVAASGREDQLALRVGPGDISLAGSF